MHAWTDGYEISEVNKSKTKKKNRKNRLSTSLACDMACNLAQTKFIVHGTRQRIVAFRLEGISKEYRRRGSNPGPQAFATRNLRMRLGARTPRFARIYFFGPDIHRETSYIKRLALYQLSYVG